ncbi:T9SS type A sorting domain-containing protein [Ferruginibacter sp. SUN002]|uniref:T9SS type A sorting domain-containing protein n=1 Tax=Ferruginibacter sp. SUN002 TaxID=2937789 RepID=UPI003D36B117
MKKTLLVLFGAISFITTLAQPTPFITCPDVNVAVLRSGDNSGIANPLSIYTIATTTGMPTLLSGPILNPANAGTNLQINGVGLNTADGFMYGLYSGSPAFSLTPATPFYRLGSNAVAVQLGTVPGPAIIPGGPYFENAAIVNSAAGEVDQFGNYYFSAVTGTAVINFSDPAASTFTPKRLFIGKIANVASLSAGVGTLSPTYVSVINSIMDASDYESSIMSPMTLATAQNTGLRDIVFNRFDNRIYTYVTYPGSGPNAGSFMGRMLKVDLPTGTYSGVSLMPSVLPFASANNEVAGTLLDKTGRFLILFTDGKMYKANSTSPGTFDGTIALLNGSTGLPTTLRGDMASCGGGPDQGTLPVSISTVNAYKQNGGVMVKWQTYSEINANEFILERSLDGQNWSVISTLQAHGTTNNVTNYQLIDNNPTGKVVYYRLCMVDNSGDKKYSDIKRISLENKVFEINTYPNPVKNVLIIEGPQSFTPKTDVVIIDAMGRIYRVSTKKVAENSISINVANLSKGVYYIHLTTEAGNEATKRFIKQ